MEKASTIANVAPSSVNISETGADLTPFQRRLVALTASGYSSHESAKKLGISVAAAERHLSSVCDKLHLSNTLELALYAVRHQLIDNA
jgi:DNA-binding CsgD family transcriptional regulator